jgi:colicin import membrane protein
MREFLREHGWAVVLSALLHGLLLGGLVVAALISVYRKPPSVQPLPIDAVVVSSQVVRAVRERAEQDAARARAAEEAKAAAAAKAAEDAKAAQDAKAADEAKAAQDAKAAEDAKSAAAEQQRVADAQKAEAQKAEAQKAAQVRRAAEADLAEQAKHAADAKKAAEAKLTADAKQAADAKQIADAKRAADDRARQDREAELRKQLADEEHRSAVESGPLRDSYIARLRNRIQAAWIKPPSAGVGLDCQVELTQVPGGEVTSAHVTQCNGDAAVRQSIENAVYRASPLPEPPDPALFDRHVVIRFKPDE